MNDLQRLKTALDLREWVEMDLGPALARGGDARLWKCPFHREQRGCSLAVWADGWRCFGACQEGGDIFDWLQKYRGLTFIEAVGVLGGTLPIASRQIRQSRFVPVDAQPPEEAWQQIAGQIAARAETILWSRQGKSARTYLQGRGLKEETIIRARLGLIPGRAEQWWRIQGLTVPSGITLPWWVGKELWAVKVRRAAGLPKYLQITGGSAHGLYNAARLEGHEAVLLVEGEFDALLAEQECGGLVGVATLGSAGRTLNPRWLPLLVGCKTILICLDKDEAGRKGAARLQAFTRRARIVELPFGKDLTEFVIQGGSVSQWLNDVL
ncbi:MAG: toprim domain-containing protein [Anaerolinea sp.]|nr:toprim domain-containing protein [Anaerolinea sp.]